MGRGTKIFAHAQPRERKKKNVSNMKCNDLYSLVLGPQQVVMVNIDQKTFFVAEGFTDVALSAESWVLYYS